MPIDSPLGYVPPFDNVPSSPSPYGTQVPDGTTLVWSQAVGSYVPGPVPGGTGASRGLTPTTVKTGAYTAAAGDLVAGDTTTAAFTVTLPSAPPVGAQVGVYKVDSTANVLTILPAGTGTIDGDPNAQCLTKNAGATVEHLGGDAWKTVSLYSAAGAAGYLRTSDAASTYVARSVAGTGAAAGKTFTLVPQPAPTAGSGLVGWTIARSALGYPVGFTWQSVAGTNDWDTGLDYQSSDLVLAYDYTVPGDQLRFRAGGHVKLGRTVGTPDTGYRMQIESDAAETGTARLLSLSTVTGSSVTRALSISKDGTENAVIESDGTYYGKQAGFGAVWNNGITGAVLQATGGAQIAAASADAYLVLARTGSSANTWVLQTSGTSLVLGENVGASNVISIATGSPALQVSATSGGIGLGSAGKAIGFFGGAGSAKPTITGSKGANAALASLLTALAALGLVTDSTT